MIAVLIYDPSTSFYTGWIFFYSSIPDCELYHNFYLRVNIIHPTLTFPIEFHLESFRTNPIKHCLFLTLLFSPSTHLTQFYSQYSHSSLYLIPFSRTLLSPYIPLHFPILPIHPQWTLLPSIFRLISTHHFSSIFQFYSTLNFDLIVPIFNPNSHPLSTIFIQYNS